MSAAGLVGVVSDGFVAAVVSVVSVSVFVAVND